MWAQNTQVPIFLLYGQIPGITPTRAAFAEFDLRPQPGSIALVEGTVYTPSGGIHLRCGKTPKGAMQLTLDVPAGLQPTLAIAARSSGPAVAHQRRPRLAVNRPTACRFANRRPS